MTQLLNNLDTMLARCLVLTALVAVATAGPPNIIRPCHLNHHACITANFAANSRCVPRPKLVPSEYNIPVFTWEAPSFNATYYDIDLLTKNHDKCFFSEYYDNLNTRKTVLTMDCPGLEMYGNRKLIQHRSFIEDTEYSFRFNTSYPLIRLTTVFNRADRLDLCSSYTFGELTGGLPRYVFTANDLKTDKFLSRDHSLMNIYEREQLFGRRNWLARSFINSVICDFGCNN